jgi:hypothetical protein
MRALVLHWLLRGLDRPGNAHPLRTRRRRGPSPARRLVFLAVVAALAALVLAVTLAAILVLVAIVGLRLLSVAARR